MNNFSFTKSKAFSFDSFAPFDTIHNSSSLKHFLFPGPVTFLLVFPSLATHSHPPVWAALHSPFKCLHLSGLCLQPLLFSSTYSLWNLPSPFMISITMESRMSLSNSTSIVKFSPKLLVKGESESVLPTHHLRVGLSLLVDIPHIPQTHWQTELHFLCFSLLHVSLPLWMPRSTTRHAAGCLQVRWVIDTWTDLLSRWNSLPLGKSFLFPTSLPSTAPG